MNIYEAFYSGESFHRMALEIVPDDWLEADSDGHWFVPSVVNLAFACELYLKFLLIKSGLQNITTHNLSHLFSALPIEIQNRIRNTPEFRGDTDFMVKLEEDKNVFKEWRYLFEGNNKSVEVIFLENFALALHNEAEGMLKKQEK